MKNLVREPRAGQRRTVAKGYCLLELCLVFTLVSGLLAWACLPGPWSWARTSAAPVVGAEAPAALPVVLRVYRWQQLPVARAGHRSMEFPALDPDQVMEERHGLHP